MSAETFAQALRAFARRTPFKPFVVELVFFSTLFATLAWIGGCAGAAANDTPTNLPSAAKYLRERARIGTDDDLAAYVSRDRITESFAAPQSMRGLIKQGDVELVARQYVGFRWEQGRVTQYWQGDLTVAGSHPEAQKLLKDQLTQSGFTDAEGRLSTHLNDAAAKLEKPLTAWLETCRLKGLPITKENLNWPLAFSRRENGIREEILINGLSPGVGGHVAKCHSQYEWDVSCEYHGGPPTLADLIAALPSLKPLHLEPALYSQLQNKPAYDFFIDTMKPTNLGWALTTEASARHDVEATLEKLEFLAGGDSKSRHLHLDGRTQYFWTRKSDYTHASIISLDDDNQRIIVGCQAPQK